ncbi:Kv channel-interacting protein 4-like isoform X3 [Dermacentor albipictus]|uniref:Kv channel-interacting protein 4-like isoform X3 n=1 Tax=Dermacentor albipictus TaxID=60249 RepID=UPI0038FBFC04
MEPTLPPKAEHSLEALCRNTKFTRHQIQLMYRSFKQECPTGFVEEDNFKHIFAQFFPYGNACSYARYVFKSFDRNRNGAISFKDLLYCLSLLCFGSVQEKLRWAFSLYDVNGDGFITRQELRDVVCSVYALLGRRSSTDERALREHVDRVFQDDTIAKSLTLLDTTL